MDLSNKQTTLPDPTADRLLTVPEVAKWLGVTESWVRAHASGRRAPQLPVVRITRGTMRFSVAALSEWIKKMGIGA